LCLAAEQANMQPGMEICDSHEVFSMIGEQILTTEQQAPDTRNKEPKPARFIPPNDDLSTKSGF